MIKKNFNLVKNFINFVKNNVLLILTAFFLLDFVFCLFTYKPANITEKRLMLHTLGMDLLWAFGLFEVWATSNIERLLSKRITLVSEEVDFMYDTIRKAVEESNKEKKEESADKEEKTFEKE